MRISTIISDIIQIVNRDHGDLTGLTDDDHSIYYNAARIATWLGTLDTDNLGEGSSNLYFSGKDQDDLGDGATYKQYNPAGVTITGGTIDGITISNLVDKSAAEVITGAWQFASLGSAFNLPLVVYSVTDSHFFGLHIRKSGQNTIGFAETVDNESLGEIVFSGVGTDQDRFDRAATIKVEQDDTKNSNWVAGRMIFKTSSRTAETVERFRINSKGALGIAGANFGTAGQIIKSGGAAAAPAWADSPSTILCGRTDDLLYTSQTRYGTVFGQATQSSSEDVLLKTLAPRAGTLKNLYIKLEKAPVGDSIVITIRINGSDTTITATLVIGATTGSDVAHTEAVAAGDLITVKCVGGGSQSATEGDVIVSLELAV